MTTTLVVLAHPEVRSFNGAWAEASVVASEKLGHTVLRSDLCAMGFDPVESAAHFPAWQPADSFDPLKAQEQAAANLALPADIASEMDKLEQADRVILHFPIWWFGPPAILKGWTDRVLVHGATHTVDARFDSGLCRGKKVLICTTLGASEDESGVDGKEGNIDMLLWPLAYTMRYLGMTVLQPRLIFGVHGYFEGVEETALQERLKRELDAHAETIAGFDARPVIQFNADTDFDESGRLRPNAPSHSPFIRHRD